MGFNIYRNKQISVASAVYAGFALAGKGTSNELSLVNAIDYAVRMAKGRKAAKKKR